MISVSKPLLTLSMVWDGGTVVLPSPKKATNRRHGLCCMAKEVCRARLNYVRRSSHSDARMQDLRCVLWSIVQWTMHMRRIVSYGESRAPHMLLNYDILRLCTMLSSSAFFDSIPRTLIGFSSPFSSCFSLVLFLWGTVYIFLLPYVLWEFLGFVWFEAKVEEIFLIPPWFIYSARKINSS